MLTSRLTAAVTEAVFKGVIYFILMLIAFLIGWLKFEVIVGLTIGSMLFDFVASLWRSRKSRVTA